MIAPTRSTAYTQYASVTPSDTNEVSKQGYYPSAISVTVAGNVALEDALGNITIVPLSVNTIYPLVHKKVRSTSTTATGIISYWVI